MAGEGCGGAEGGKAWEGTARGPPAGLTLWQPWGHRPPVTPGTAQGCRGPARATPDTLTLTRTLILTRTLNRALTLTVALTLTLTHTLRPTRTIPRTRTLSRTLTLTLTLTLTQA